MRMSHDLLCTIVPSDGRNPPPTETGGAPVWQIELALTGEQHYHGLSHRPVLRANHGMLFVFSEPQILSFCMRRCFISLDIAFISSDMRVVQLETMPVEAYGQEMRTYSSLLPAQYALEVNAGELRRRGVCEGDSVLLSDNVQKLLARLFLPQT